MVQAAIWAVGGAMLSRELGILAVALVLALVLALSLWQQRLGSWLCALPCALSAASLPPSPPLLPAPGPVWFSAEVLPGSRCDPIQKTCYLRLRQHRQKFSCAVIGMLDVVPGDRVQGYARLLPTMAQAAAGPAPSPRLQAQHDALQVRAGPLSPMGMAQNLRLQLQRSMLAAVSGEESILLCHLVLGQGPALPDALVRGHRHTGLSHLLAVSGAHLTMLAWMLGLAFAKLSQRSALNSKGFRTGTALLLLFYALITGMEPPVFRAVVAAWVFLFANGRGRPVSLAAVLAVPALLTALFLPEDLFGVSFNLSYAAVFGLGMAGVFRPGLDRRKFWVLALHASLWATLLTTPFSLYYFGRFTPWCILATPLLSPLVALMLGLGLGTSLLGLILPKVAALLGIVLQALTWFYSQIVLGIAQLPLAPVYAEQLANPWTLLAAALLGLALLLWLQRLRGALAFCLCISLPHFFTSTEENVPNMQVLSVGHGQACLLQMQDGTQVLVDCGNQGRGHRAATAVRNALAPRRRLDLCILSHQDADHISGIPSLLQWVQIQTAILPTEMRQHDISNLLASQGCELHFMAPGQELRLRPDLCLWRPALTGLSDNEQSIWLQAQLPGFRALFPGDALAQGIAAYLRSPWAGEAEVLLLPHHGRPLDCVDQLLTRVRPRLALVSAATGDGYSAQAQVARALGIQVLHTGLQGNLTLRATDPPGIDLQKPLCLGPPLLVKPEAHEDKNIQDDDQQTPPPDPLPSPAQRPR